MFIPLSKSCDEISREFGVASKSAEQISSIHILPPAGTMNEDEAVAIIDWLNISKDVFNNGALGIGRVGISSSGTLHVGGGFRVMARDGELCVVLPNEICGCLACELIDRLLLVIANRPGPKSEHRI
jgi:hypothetical protein